MVCLPSGPCQQIGKICDDIHKPGPCFLLIVLAAPHTGAHFQESRLTCLLLLLEIGRCWRWCNDVGDWSIAADPLPTTTGSCTHNDMDVERVTPSELQPENDVQDPVRHGAVAQKVVNAVAKLGDPSRVEYFFKRMEVCDLEPSQMMRDTLMSICLRKSDDIRAGNFLMRVLMVSEDCERSRHILSAESRKRLTISSVLFILMFIYRGFA